MRDEASYRVSRREIVDRRMGKCPEWNRAVDHRSNDHWWSPLERETMWRETIGNDHDEVKEKTNVLLAQLESFLGDLIEQNRWKSEYSFSWSWQRFRLAKSQISLFFQDTCQLKNEPRSEIIWWKDTPHRQHRSLTTLRIVRRRRNDRLTETLLQHVFSGQCRFFF